MSLAALSSNRSFNDCCSDLRPFIVSVDTTDTTSATIATVTSSTIEITDVEQITVTQLNATTVIASQVTSDTVTTTTLQTTFIDSFSVLEGDDVKFLGAIDAVNDKFFWDSSASTLYIDGDFKVREPFLYLSADSVENPPTIEIANRDNGILFNWFDDSITEAKLGFFGFNESSNRFIFNSNVEVTSDIVTGITEVFGDIEVGTLFANHLTNEDVLLDLNITSISDINVQSNNLNNTITNDINLTSTIGDINLITDAGNVNLDITGDLTLDITNGIIDILVDGQTTDNITIENTIGTIDITTGSTSSQAIYLTTQNGGILLENQSIDNNITLNTVSNILLSTTGTTTMTFDEDDGIVVNKAKSDYLKWYPYYKFDTITGIWFTNRDVPSSNPIHSWSKEANEETTTLFSDLDLSSRTTTDKGFQLKSIYFAYKIQTAVINGVEPLFTLKTFNPSVPGAGVTLTNIPFTDVNLTSGTTIGDHYRSVDITTPFFINDESTLNVELAISSASTSDVDFYGIHLLFNINNL